jgi:hypothetical protein
MSSSNEQVVFMPLALAMIAMHSRKYRTAQVHGLLIGALDDGKVRVCDTIPICHEAPTKSIVESATNVAFSIIQAETTSKHVVGWYTVPELFGEDNPGAAALRIVASLENVIPKAILVSISKTGVDNFTEAVDGGLYDEHVKAYGKDFGMQWQERLAAVIEPVDSQEIKALRACIDDEQFCDLTDHWLSPSRSEWPKPCKIKSLAEKYSR